MRKNIIIIGCLLILGTTFTTLFISSCSKDEVLNNTKSKESDKILRFKDLNEYNEVQRSVLSMNSQVLKAYEESKGYISFGRLCDELYNSIDPLNFKSTEEVKEFVTKNSKYLQFVEDEKGELELETKFYNTAERYFFNNEKIFQIGDTVFKVFEEGTVKASFKDINIFKQVGDNIDCYKQDTRFVFIPNTKSVTKNYKSTTDLQYPYDCGNSVEFRSTNGNNRLKVEIESKLKGYTQTVCHFIQRPYKKTLGIWFWCSRTMKADIRITFTAFADHCHDGQCGYLGWVFDDLIYYEDYTMASKFEVSQTLNFEWIQNGGGEDSNFLTRYDVWADTYSVSPIDYACN